MKILHCSDIHLGASMRTHLSLEQATKRKEELLHTFKQMVEYASKNDIQNILIAGDLLDTDYADTKTSNVLIDLLLAYQDIHFYYLCGNHDEDNLLLKRDLPSNLHTFGYDWQSYDLGGVRLTGAILGSHNFDLYSKLNLDSREFNIVLLHGGETYANDYDTPDTVNLDALKNKNIDYLALGHLHTFKQAKLDNRGIYAYSGCLEGRGFDECGPKGFVVLDVNENDFDIEFVPFAKRQLHEVKVDITGLSTLTQFSKAIGSALDNISREDFVRVIFVGEYTEQSQKYLNIATMDFAKQYYFFTYKDKSKPKIDIDSLEQDISIKGEFVRTVRASELTLEEQNEIIMLGLRALNGEEVDE